MSPKPSLTECIQYGESIRKRYRASLLHVGKSPDYHIYDLRLEDLRRFRHDQEGHYLVKVKLYYESLSTSDKRIFVAEILEKDRVYPFWFYDENYGVTKDFESRRRRLLYDLRSSL